MVVICYASDVIEYDRGTTELSSAALHMTQDATTVYKNRPLNLRLRLT